MRRSQLRVLMGSLDWFQKDLSFPQNNTSFSLLLKRVCSFILREREREGGRERETERGREGEGEKGKDRERESQESQSNVGLDLMNHEVMTWAKVKSWTLNQLSDPGAPTHPSLNSQPLCPVMGALWTYSSWSLDRVYSLPNHRTVVPSFTNPDGTIASRKA